jgi:hypothetical protein
MYNKEHLIYVKYDSIDYEKWDRCINEASNSRVYAASWYLDRMAVEWDALVYGDYEFVMPLPFKRKYGISYLYQPPFSQQLGIFPLPTHQISEAFFREIICRFRYCDVQLNSLNRPAKDEPLIQFLPRKNYLLHLGTDYENILAGYSKNAHRNIAKGNNNRLNFVEGIQMEEFLKLKQKNLLAKLSKIDFQKLKSIIAYSQYKGFGEIAGVYSPGNNLCAAVFFCKWKDRIIYMNAASSREGKEMRSMFFLMDHFLQATAEKSLTLDFEGSMLPGVARFFEGFGATPETYYRMKFNRLPVPFRWIKKDAR